MGRQDEPKPPSSALARWKLLFEHDAINCLKIQIHRTRQSTLGEKDWAFIFPMIYFCRQGCCLPIRPTADGGSSSIRQATACLDGRWCEEKSQRLSMSRRWGISERLDMCHGTDCHDSDEAAPGVVPTAFRTVLQSSSSCHGASESSWSKTP